MLNPHDEHDCFFSFTSFVDCFWEFFQDEITIKKYILMIPYTYYDTLTNKFHNKIRKSCYKLSN